MACGIAFALACCVCEAHSSARAQTQGEAELLWLAPEECPARAYVLARIREHLAAEEHQLPAWQALARIVQEREGYRLDLEVRAADAPVAQRRLRAATCPALADAAAVLIALAIEPQPTASEATDTQSREAPVQPPAADAPAAAAAATPERSSVPRAESKQPAEREGAGESDADSGRTFSVPIEVALGAALRLDVGTLPQRPGLGVQPHVGLHVGPLRLRVGFTVLLPGDARSATYPTAVVHGRALLGELAAGAAVTALPLRFTPEVVLEHGELTFEVSEIAAPEPTRVRWTALGAGVNGAYVLPFGLELHARVAGLLPFSRPRPVVQTSAGDVPVFTVSAFLLRFSLGGAYVFP